MTDKTKYWLRNPSSETYALAEGTDERDRLIPLGHELADEPTDPDFVWMRHEGGAGSARMPFGAREHNEARGWVFSGPPDPVDLTKDPQLVDPAPVAVEPTPAPKAVDKKPEPATTK